MGSKNTATLWKGQIWSAFPASGKTYCWERYNEIVIDLWRTSYKHIITKEQLSDLEKDKWLIKEINPERPYNYLKAIVEATHKYNIVLVNESILELLREKRIPYSLVVPTLDCKEEYKKRMIQRGNDQVLINKITNKFEVYINENLKDNYATVIYRLSKWQYLSDLVNTLRIP